jgi:hypothetical protein
MKKLLLAFLFNSCLIAYAQPNHVVISQAFGAGGNNGSLFTHDFVELFNPTQSSVSLQGWSLQYSTATGSSWNSNKVDLTGTIEPGKYFLIQLAGGSNGSALPKPDFSSTNINVSATSGKIALVNNTTILTGNCPAGSNIVDFVGFGNGDCFEKAPAAAMSNATAIIRVNNGCADTDNNYSDFSIDVPSPRNSSSPANFCNGSVINITSITPIPFCVDGNNQASGTVNYSTTGSFNNATFKVVLSDVNGSFVVPLQVGSAVVSGTNPTGSIAVSIPASSISGIKYRLRVDVVDPSQTGLQSNAFEIINGTKNIASFIAAPNTGQMTLHWSNPSGCFDEILIVAKESAFSATMPVGDGTAYTADLVYNGNGTPFDGGKVVYKGTASGQTITGLNNGTRYYFKAFTRRGNVWSNGTEASETVRLVPLPGEVLINQVHPGYSKATDEYIELVNVTNKTFDLSDLAIRFADANGSNVVAGGTLSGMLQPHSYWLVSPNATITVGQTVAIATDNKMDGGFGVQNQQVALFRKTDNTLLDAVAYGTIATKTFVEGNAAPNPGSTNGLKRIIDGKDNNNNQQDFVVVKNGDIDLRNSTSRLANNNALIAGGNYTRLYVTGDAALSGSISLSEKLVLINGYFTLNEHHLTTKEVTGGSSKTYVKTNAGGALLINEVQGTSKTFAVGNSTYNPVTISNGSNLLWRVRVTDEVAASAAPFNKNKSIQRTWHIEPDATPTYGATITFEYNDADAAQTGSDFDKREQLQVWNNHSTKWLPAGNAQQPEEVAGAKKVTVTDWKQFSPFVIANVIAEMTVLPVKFSEVKATELPQGIQISFTNSIESEVAHYIIERSVNGIDYLPLATIQPMYNNGSAAGYTWLDVQPVVGSNLYRIKGVETDGKYLYSAIVRMNINRNVKAFNIYPNPVKGTKLTWEASLPKGKSIIKVTGSNGQQLLVRSFEYEGGNISQMLDLPAGTRPGIYTLQIINVGFYLQQSFVVM